MPSSPIRVPTLAVLGQLANQNYDDDCLLSGTSAVTVLSEDQVNNGTAAVELVVKTTGAIPLVHRGAVNDDVLAIRAA